MRFDTVDEDTTPEAIDLWTEQTVTEIVLRGGPGAYPLGVALAEYLNRAAEVDACACVTEGRTVLRLCVRPASVADGDGPIPTLPRLPALDGRS